VTPELPPLKWDGYSWEGEVVLPSWRAFHTPRGRAVRAKNHGPSEGTVRIRFKAAGNEPPAESQTAAYRWLLDHEAESTSAVLSAAFAEYPRYREEFIDAYDDEDAQSAAQQAPPLERAEELSALMEPYCVFVLPVEKDGVAYVGFEFKCVWEAEHGLGVLTHKGRVVEVGHAPTAFDARLARKDAARKG
jgi:hypothetical protein